MNMEERNGQSSSEDSISGDNSWDDFEYLEWVRERDQEALEAKLPKKVTFKEMLFTSVFVLIILAVAIYLPFKAITGDEGDHKSYSLWVEDLSERTELVVAEYVFLGSNQVSGVYFGREDLIIIERRADSTTYIHELAHAADKYNYFPWEEELKEKLFSTFISEELSSLLLEGASGQKIRSELFADAVLFIETKKCGSYFSSLDCHALAVTTKNFVKDNALELSELDSQVDYMTPDLIIDGPVTRASNITPY